MELPSSTVLGVTLQKSKVFTFIASMTVIASVVYPVIPFISYIIGKMFIPRREERSEPDWVHLTVFPI